MDTTVNSFTCEYAKSLISHKFHVTIAPTTPKRGKPTPGIEFEAYPTQIRMFDQYTLLLTFKLNDGQNISQWWTTPQSKMTPDNIQMIS